MMQLPLPLLQQGIRRGTILLSDSFENIDHPKFFAIIGVYRDCVAGFFFINSRIHPAIFSKPLQFAMQYQLRKTDYDFLRYDSFLGADALLTRPLEALAKSISEGSTTIVGHLTDIDLTNILEACRKSPLFKPSEKKRFFY